LRVALSRRLSCGRRSSFTLCCGSRLGFLVLLLARPGVDSAAIGLSDCLVQEGAQLLSSIESYIAHDDPALSKNNLAPTLVPGMVEGVYEPIELDHKGEVGLGLEADAQPAMLNFAAAPIDATVRGSAARQRTAD
jgi:hypothetical protein